jgi:hypothetical protein
MTSKLKLLLVPAIAALCFAQGDSIGKNKWLWGWAGYLRCRAATHPVWMPDQESRYR